MKYYADSLNDKVYALELDGSQDHLITETMTLLSNDQLEEITSPTPQELSHQIAFLRKVEEAKGVSLNGVQYSGDSSNRQALSEALAMASEMDLVAFPTWKDSGGNYLKDHPVSEVKEALLAIGTRRIYLIGLEGQYVSGVLDGSITDLETLSWNF